MGNSSFNGLFASPGKVVLLEEEDLKPGITPPDDELCGACGNRYTILEVINGRCFCCRYGAELNRGVK